MAARQILPNQTLEDLRVQFNALSADDFGDIGTLDPSLTATTVIGAVNELSAQVGAAEGWYMEDTTSTIQQVGAGQTARFLGSSNQINAVVSSPDTLTLSLNDNVTLVTSLSVPTVNAGNLTISSGYITDSSGIINFDNENITTTNEVSGGTGTFGTVVGTGGTHTLGTVQVSGNQISSTDSTELVVNDNLQILGDVKANNFTPLSFKYTCFNLVSLSPFLNWIASKLIKSFKTLFKLCLVILSFFRSSEIVIPSYKDIKWITLLWATPIEYLSNIFLTSETVSL